MKKNIIKTIVLTMLAFLLVGCFPFGGRKAEPKQSVAKESVWDYYLVGTWKTDEGTEIFCGDGNYLCYTTDQKGNDITIEGTWRLDDTEDYVVWVTYNKVKRGKKTVSREQRKQKYVVNALAPNQYLNYQVGEKYRSANWVKQ